MSLNLSPASALVRKRIQQRLDYFSEQDYPAYLAQMLRFIQQDGLSHQARRQEFRLLNRLLSDGLTLPQTPACWLKLFCAAGEYALRYGYAPHWWDLYQHAQNLLTQEPYADYQAEVLSFGLGLRYYSGDYSTPCQTIEQELSVLSKSGKPASYHQALSHAANHCTERGHPEQAVQFLQTGLAHPLIQQADNSQALQLTLALQLSECLRRSGKFTESLAWLDHISQHSEAIAHLDPEWQAEFFMTLGLSKCWSQVRFQPAISAFEQAIHLYEQLEDASNHLGAIADLGLVYWLQGKLELAQHYLDSAYHRAAQTVNLPWRIRIIAQSALCLIKRGAFEASLARLDEAFQLAHPIQYDYGLALVYGYRAMAYLYLGQWAESQACFNQVPKLSTPNLMRGIALQQARLYAWQGNHAAAQAILHPIVEWAREHNVHVWLHLRSYAETCPPEQAYALLQEAYALAEPHEAHYELAACALALAECAPSEAERQTWHKHGMALIEPCGAQAWLANAVPYPHRLLNF